jgi:hypothetical protein
MNRTWKGFAIALGSAIAVLTLAACSDGGDTSAAEAKTVNYQMDYPSYDSSDSLYQKADLVVEAKVSDTTRVEQLKASASDNDPKTNPNAGANGKAPEPLVVTIYQATVVKTFKGTKAAGDTVEVKQLGGVLKGVTYREVDAPTLKPGETYLLFLATYPDAPASLLNPRQGQYPLETTGEPRSVGGNAVKVSKSDLARLSPPK